MTGYELDNLAVFVFFLIGFGLAGLVICWAVKEVALSIIDIHKAWSDAKLKRENIKLVHPTESGLLPVARHLVDSGILADQVLTLIAQRIDAYRLP